MSAERKDCKADISFSEWFGLVCKYDRLAYFQLLNVVLVMVCASFLTMHIPLVGFSWVIVNFSLFFGLGGAFTWAFHRAWRRSLENPPWYLKEWETGHARTDND